MKDFENDSKLSDSNPISLCPQVTVNGDDLVNLISNPDVKVNYFTWQYRYLLTFRLNWFKFLVQLQLTWTSNDTIQYRLA